MDGGLLVSGQGKEHTPAAALAVAAGAHPTRYPACLIAFGVAFASAVAYAGFVLSVTDIYTHSWIEKLQMLPLCIVAVTAPMLWAIMFRKFHGKMQRASREGGRGCELCSPSCAAVAGDSCNQFMLN